MNNKVSNKCWKCQEKEGSFYHMWWTCIKAKHFWMEIHKEMMKILGYSIYKTPEKFLVGLNLETMLAKDRTLIWYTVSAARMVYAKDWKQDKVPEIEGWLQKNDTCDGDG